MKMSPPVLLRAPFPGLVARPWLALGCLGLLGGAALGEPVSEPARKTLFITRSSGGSDVRARLEAVRELSDRLPPADARALLEFVSRPREEDIPLPLWHAFANDVLDLLLRQRDLPPGLEEYVISLSLREGDAVLRDYALQKLDRLVARSKAGTTPALALESVQKAAALSGSNLQGTALLTWRRMLPRGEAAFEKALTGCLRSPDSTPAARASALQAGMAAGSGSAAVKSATAAAAREILTRRDEQPVLIIGALSALGSAGSEEDFALIRELAAHPNYSRVAQAALDRLSLSGPSGTPPSR